MLQLILAGLGLLGLLVGGAVVAPKILGFAALIWFGAYLIARMDA